MKSHRLWLIVGWLLAAVGPTAAQVTLQLETKTYVPGGSPSENPLLIDTDNLAGASASVSTAFGTGSAQASLGLMQLASSSSVTHEAEFGETLTTQGYGQARWEDSILVTAAAPELAGAAGRLHARFMVSGNLTVPGSVDSTYSGARVASAGWSLNVNRALSFGDENTVSGSRAIDIVWNGSSNEAELAGSPNFLTYDLFIPFTFGESFTFRVTGEANTSVQPLGLAVGDGLNASSNVVVTWLGISGVTDENGNSLTGTAIASTGDWITTSAIPEPSTYAAIAGLLALGSAAWWRRARG